MIFLASVIPVLVMRTKNRQGCPNCAGRMGSVAIFTDNSGLVDEKTVAGGCDGKSGSGIGEGSGGDGGVGLGDVPG